LLLNGMTTGASDNGAPGAMLHDSYWADAIRRGRPSTFSWKSGASSPFTGRPVESTTVTSTATTSTPARNVGGACWGGV